MKREKIVKKMKQEFIGGNLVPFNDVELKFPTRNIYQQGKKIIVAAGSMVYSFKSKPFYWAGMASFLARVFLIKKLDSDEKRLCPNGCGEMKGLPLPDTPFLECIKCGCNEEDLVYPPVMAFIHTVEGGAVIHNKSFEWNEYEDVLLRHEDEILKVSIIPRNFTPSQQTERLKKLFAEKTSLSYVKDFQKP